MDTLSDTEVAEDPSTVGPWIGLRMFLELDLEYRPDVPATASSEGRAGEYLGSGIGTVDGRSLRGRVRWDLYEVVGRDPCETNFAGFIETEDGARITFETKGWGSIPDATTPSRWNMVAALSFHSAHTDYAWLNRILAVWVGDFDTSTYRHKYKVYVRGDAATPSGQL